MNTALLSSTSSTLVVHYNSKYGDPAAAVDKPDGLAVLGMFIKTGAHHPEFEVLCKNLKEIQTKNSTINLEDTLNPANCLPGTWKKRFFSLSILENNSS